MATINASSSADIIVPSNNGTTYRGLGGDDTYIISNAASGNITIVDTSGSNTIQLVDGLSIASSKFAADSVQLTLSNGAVITVNGADKFSYDVGGNSTSGVTGTSKDYAGLASDMGVSSLPTGSTITDGGAGTVSGAAISTGSISYSLSADATSVAEGSSITYTVTASSAPTSDVTLTYNVTGDDNGGTVDKAGASDLVALSGTVTMASGSTTATFTVTPNADSDLEGLEGIKVTVFDGSLDVIGSATALISNTATAANSTSNLTTVTDTIEAGAGDNTIGGMVIGASATGTTAQAGDVIDGGEGNDTFKLSVSGDAGGADSITAIQTSNVETLSINNFEENAGATTINMALMKGVTTVGLSSSKDTGDTILTNVDTLDTVQYKQGSGDLTVTYAAAVVAGAADSVNVHVDGQTAGTLTLAGIETLNFTASGTKSTITTVTATSATAMTLSGDVKLTVSTAPATLQSIDLSASTGGSSITIAPSSVLAVTGGSGNDALNLTTTLSTLTSFNGGDGVDTLTITDADDLTKFTAPGVTNVEVLSAATGDATSYDASLISGIVSLVATDLTGGSELTFSNMDATTSNVTITTGSTGNINGTLAIDGTDDTLNLTLGHTGGAAFTIANTDFDDHETINVVNSAVGNAVTITSFDADNASTLNFSGNKAVTITLEAGTTNVTTIDASGFTGTGALVMTAGRGSLSVGQTITGGGYNDTLYGATYGDTIKGGAGNDTIYGGGLGDTIHGGAGNDTIYGQAGIDTIEAGAGNDTIMVTTAAQFEDLVSAEAVDGGDGTDSLTFGTAAGNVAWTIAATDVAKVKNVEKLIFAGDAAATLTLNDDMYTYGGNTSVIIDDTDVTAALTVTASSLSAANSIDVRSSGGAVNDSFTGGAGDDLFTFDTVTSGAALDGSDTVAGGKGSDTLTISVTGGIALIAASQSGVTNVETIKFVGTGNVDAAYTLADATFNTTGVAATGGTGADLAIVGTVDASGMTGDGALTFTGTAEDDSKINITGGRGGDTLKGGQKADTIDGGDGADTIDGDAGIDVLTGGSGNDTFQVSNATSGTDFIGLTSTETVDGGAGTDTLDFTTGAPTVAAADLLGISSIEKIAFSTTGAVDLTIADNVFTANGSTTLKIEDSENSAAFTFSAAGVSAANSVKVYIKDTESVTETITGGSGNDTIYYTNGNQEAWGIADVINGGAGTDSIVVYVDGGNAINLANSGNGLTNVSYIENMTFATTAGTSAVAITLADANFVSVTGGSVSFASVAGAVTFDGDLENDSALTITGGTGADSLIGTDTVATGDTISGGNSADTIEGSKGGDTLTGGAGADTFFYAAVADSSGSTVDTITDFLSGSDKLKITIDESSATAAKTVVFTINVGGTTSQASKQTAQDALTGNIGQMTYVTDTGTLWVNMNADNLLTSLDLAIKINAGATATSTVASTDTIGVITTGSGGDTVTGGAGADIISTGAGADTVDGGLGADIITLGASDSGADIVDFSGDGISTDVVKKFDTTEDKMSFDGLTGITATSGTAAPTDAGGEEGANGTAALIDGAVYVIDNETQPILDEGEEAVGDFTSLTDVAAYLGEAYTSTAASDAAIFIINDPSNNASGTPDAYVYYFVEDAGEASTISASELTLIGKIHEEGLVVVVAGDVA